MASLFDRGQSNRGPARLIDVTEATVCYQADSRRRRCTTGTPTRLLVAAYAEAIATWL